MSGKRGSGLSAYLDEVAAGTPVPGGGSVTAVVGALAAALGEMVANLTLGREKYAGAEASLRRGAGPADRIAESSWTLRQQTNPPTSRTGTRRAYPAPVIAKRPRGRTRCSER